MRLLIIGGSDAGISAALRAREIDPHTEVHMLLADDYPNFSICGLPFYLSGEVADWKTLAHRSRNDIEFAGVRLHLSETAVSIDPLEHTVTSHDAEGARRTHAFDRLVIATGAIPILPPISGADHPNVFSLHTLDDAFALQKKLSTGVKSAVIVGGGYIGLETADALRHRDIAVTLIERLPAILRTVDQPMGMRVESVLARNGVQVRTNMTVRSIDPDANQLLVRCADGSTAAGDLVLLALGVRPRAELAATCGIATDERGAIRVDRQMRTNVPDIFAAGDCVTTWHRLLEKDLYLPLGTTSHKQGRIAGENAVGGIREFAGSLGTQSVKLFDRVVAATGLSEAEASAHGLPIFATETITADHKAYYPGATELVVRLIGHWETGRLLGGQLLGSYGHEVSKRVDVLAAAIHQGLRVDEVNDLDLSYTPPLSSPWDPLQMAAQHWQARRDAQERPQR
ncbi:MAG: FAD-dependent oxidoreductase [Proteobacteria bacterium]|nr:FAD-dependent oxidoreductase [Pseudomonadota bacterium]